jgi:hypothetical protein
MELDKRIKTMPKDEKLLDNTAVSAKKTFIRLSQSEAFFNKLISELSSKTEAEINDIFIGFDCEFKTKQIIPSITARILFWSSFIIVGIMTVFAILFAATADTGSDAIIRVIVVIMIGSILAFISYKLADSKRRAEHSEEEIKEVAQKRANEIELAAQKDIYIYFNKLIEKFKNDADIFNSIYKVDIENAKTIIIEKSHLAFQDKSACYNINKDEIVFFDIPKVSILRFHFTTGLLPKSDLSIDQYQEMALRMHETDLVYTIPYLHANNLITPYRYSEKDIVSFTYLGTEVVKVTGGEVNLIGIGMTGAIIWGALFGTLTLNNEICDLREVLVTLSDNKMIDVKGIDFYKDLLCYFPDKELHSHVKNQDVISEPIIGGAANIINKKDILTIKEQLKEFKGMLDEGLITQEDYDEKKKLILEEFNENNLA